MNLSETVFFAPVEGQDAFGIRWFTPTKEVDLIGHATLAAGHLVFQRMRPAASSIRFLSNGVELAVSKRDAALALEMPALRPRPVEAVLSLARGLGRQPKAVLSAKHYLCVFDHLEEVAQLEPDMIELSKLDLPGVIVTAPGDGLSDFVSRFFAPANGVPEDPVSGVAHLCLAPYWAERLAKKVIVGRQLSARDGMVHCEDLGSRVRLIGNSVIFLEGYISIDCIDRNAICGRLQP